MRRLIIFSRYSDVVTSSNEVISLLSMKVEMYSVAMRKSMRLLPRIFVLGTFYKQ